MYRLADPNSPLRKLDIETRGNGTLKGELLAPRVQLIVEEEYTRLKYYMNFKSGILDTFTTNNPRDPTSVQYDISGWVCVFKIAISEFASRVHDETTDLAVIYRARHDIARLARV